MPEASAISDVKSIDLSPSAKLSRDVIGSRLNLIWFSTSRRVDAASKANMADAAGSTTSAFSAGLRLMDSKHPVIKEANELRRRIEATWKSTTIPLAVYASCDHRPEPGVRLIAADAETVADFDRRMTALATELRIMEKRVNEALPDIKKMDALRLKALYKAEHYPSSVVLGVSWGYVNVSVPAVLEKLAPEVYKRELASAKEHMERSCSLALTSMLEEFHAVIASWIESLGPVVRLYPAETHPLYGAEVCSCISHAQDESVPEGKFRLILKPQTGNTARQTLDMTEVEYNLLKPKVVSGEHKRFHTSTIESLGDFINVFRNVSDILQAPPELESMVKRVEAQMTKVASPEQFAEELRRSTVVRNDTHTLAVQLESQLSKMIENVKTSRRAVVLTED